MFFVAMFVVRQKSEIMFWMRSNLIVRFNYACIVWSKRPVLQEWDVQAAGNAFYNVRGGMNGETHT